MRSRKPEKPVPTIISNSDPLTSSAGVRDRPVDALDEPSLQPGPFLAPLASSDPAPHPLKFDRATDLLATHRARRAAPVDDARNRQIDLRDLHALLATPARDPKRSLGAYLEALEALTDGEHHKPRGVHRSVWKFARAVAELGLTKADVLGFIGDGVLPPHAYERLMGAMTSTSKADQSAAKMTVNFLLGARKAAALAAREPDLARDIERLERSFARTLAEDLREWVERLQATTTVEPPPTQVDDSPATAMVKPVNADAWLSKTTALITRATDRLKAEPTRGTLTEIGGAFLDRLDALDAMIADETYPTELEPLLADRDRIEATLREIERRLLVSVDLELAPSIALASEMHDLLARAEHAYWRETKPKRLDALKRSLDKNKLVLDEEIRRLKGLLEWSRAVPLGDDHTARTQHNVATMLLHGGNSLRPLDEQIAELRSLRDGVAELNAQFTARDGALDSALDDHLKKLGLKRDGETLEDAVDRAFDQLGVPAKHRPSPPADASYLERVQWFDRATRVMVAQAFVRVGALVDGLLGIEAPNDAGLPTSGLVDQLDAMTNLLAAGVGLELPVDKASRSALFTGKLDASTVLGRALIAHADKLATIDGGELRKLVDVLARGPVTIRDLEGVTGDFAIPAAVRRTAVKILKNPELFEKIGGRYATTERIKKAATWLDGYRDPLATDRVFAGAQRWSKWLREALKPRRPDRNELEAFGKLPMHQKIAVLTDLEKQRPKLDVAGLVLEIEDRELQARALVQIFTPNRQERAERLEAELLNTGARAFWKKRQEKHKHPASAPYLLDELRTNRALASWAARWFDVTPSATAVDTLAGLVGNAESTLAAYEADPTPEKRRDAAVAMADAELAADTIVAKMERGIQDGRAFVRDAATAADALATVTVTGVSVLAALYTGGAGGGAVATVGGMLRAATIGTLGGTMIGGVIVGTKKLANTIGGDGRGRSGKEVAKAILGYAEQSLLSATGVAGPAFLAPKLASSANIARLLATSSTSTTAQRAASVALRGLLAGGAGAAVSTVSLAGMAGVHGLLGDDVGALDRWGSIPEQAATALASGIIGAPLAGSKLGATATIALDAGLGAGVTFGVGTLLGRDVRLEEILTGAATSIGVGLGSNTILRRGAVPTATDPASKSRSIGASWASKLTGNSLRRMKRLVARALRKSSAEVDLSSFYDEAKGVAAKQPGASALASEQTAKAAVQWLAAQKVMERFEGRDIRAADLSTAGLDTLLADYDAYVVGANLELDGVAPPVERLRADWKKLMDDPKELLVNDFLPKEGARVGGYSDDLFRVVTALTDVETSVALKDLVTTLNDPDALFQEALRLRKQVTVQAIIEGRPGDWQNLDVLQTVMIDRLARGGLTLVSAVPRELTYAEIYETLSGGNAFLDQVFAKKPTKHGRHPHALTIMFGVDILARKHRLPLAEVMRRMAKVFEETGKANFTAYLGPADIERALRLNGQGKDLLYTIKAGARTAIDLWTSLFDPINQTTLVKPEVAMRILQVVLPMLD